MTQLTLNLDFTDSKRGVSRRIVQKPVNGLKNTVYTRMIYINQVLKQAL